MHKLSEEKPDPPKRPLSAFLLFRGDVFSEVRAQNPRCRVTELTTIIA